MVDLWAPWCAPCRAVGPALERVAGELAGSVKLVKVNVDEAPRLQARFGVRAVPTLMILRDGKVLARQAGGAPANVLRGWVERTLGSAAGGA
ncbi:thioredoxin domain-containing protein [Dactylosporangium sp. NPDC051485]|uniref:thioredoxin family protein n=1 Tax=Dactylosporangium sp. NPDC051485 TaxID=3154846 RepID=UPI0034195B88